MSGLIYIRTDASLQIGGGHVMRCLALAEYLRGRGTAVHFICRELPGDLINRVEMAGFMVHRLAPPAGTPSSLPVTPHGGWLEVSEDLDAQQTHAILRQAVRQPDWLLVDHYALDRSWEDQVKPAVASLAVIDDLADRAHRCELLVDQALTSAAGARYRGLVPASCRLLLGPRFALLRAEFAQRRVFGQREVGKLRRVLVSFGALDGKNQTVKALEAMRKLDLGPVAIDVVAGPASLNLAAIQVACAATPRCRLHSPAENISELMARADLAIGAGGVTSWERCSVGLPAIVIQVGGNQRLMCEALHRAGAIEFLGEHSEVSVGAIVQAIALLAHDLAARRRMSQRAFAIADGQGALRIACFLGPLVLRRARRDDCALLWQWANDPGVRESSFNTTSIPWETHEPWFENKLASSNTVLFVAENARAPIGQIRFDVAEGRATVDISLDRQHRGQGHGLELLLKGVALLSDHAAVSEVIAEVKISNAPSRTLFEQAGFQEAGEEGGIVTFKWRAANHGAPT